MKWANPSTLWRPACPPRAEAFSDPLETARWAAGLPAVWRLQFARGRLGGRPTFDISRCGIIDYRLTAVRPPNSPHVYSEVTTSNTTASFTRFFAAAPVLNVAGAALTWILPPAAENALTS
jgi:hypothetical protein